MKILLLGATGLVGKICLQKFIKDPAFSRVTCLSRKSITVDGEKNKLRQILTDFEDLNKFPDAFEVDCVVNAMGTTIRKAGSQDTFVKVDLVYPEKIAEHAKKGGASHFISISALGADIKSRVFYNRVKGDLESRIKALGFEKTTFIRPSLLLGKRAEFRPGEKAGEFLLKVLGPVVPKKWKGIPVEKVARAVVALAKREKAGLKIVDSENLHDF